MTPRSASRFTKSKPKNSAAATKACSSGDDAESSRRPLTDSSSTEWLTAMLSINSRQSFASSSPRASAAKSDGAPGASS